MNFISLLIFLLHTVSSHADQLQFYGSTYASKRALKDPVDCNEVEFEEKNLTDPLVFRAFRKSCFPQVSAKFCIQYLSQALAGDRLQAANRLLDAWNNSLPHGDAQDMKLTDTFRSSEEYRDHRLVSFFSVFLRNHGDSGDVREFCSAYAAEQVQEMEYFKVLSFNRPITRYRHDDWFFVSKYGLTESQIDRLRNYTEEDAAKFNEALRSDQPLSEMRKAQIRKTIEAMRKFPAYEGRMIRFARLSPIQMEEHQKDAIVTYRAFTSTSKDPNWNYDPYRGRNPEPNHKFIIFGKSGRWIEEISSHKEEQEVVFMPGTRFKVLSREPIPESPGTFEFVMQEIAAP